MSINRNHRVFSQHACCELPRRERVVSERNGAFTERALSSALVTACLLDCTTPEVCFGIPPFHLCLTSWLRRNKWRQSKLGDVLIWTQPRHRRHQLISSVPAAGQQLLLGRLTTLLGLGAPVHLLQRNGKHNGTASFPNSKSLQGLHLLSAGFMQRRLEIRAQELLCEIGDVRGHRMLSSCAQVSWMQLVWTQSYQQC